MRGCVTQLGGGTSDELAGADDGHEVTGIQGVRHLGTGNRAGLAATQAREGNLLAELLVDVPDEGMIVALDADRAVRQGGGGVLVVAAVVQGSHRCGQHTDDAEEVGDRITDRRSGGITRGLAGGRQCGRVRDGTREGTGDEWNIHSHGFTDVEACCGSDAVEGDHRQNRADRGLEVVEERRARVDADREGEQCQAEGAQLGGDSQLDIVGLRPRSQRDGKKENGRSAEANALDFHMAKRHAYTDENEEEQNWLLAQNLEHLLHDEISVLWIVI